MILILFSLIWDGRFHGTSWIKKKDWQPEYAIQMVCNMWLLILQKINLIKLPFTAWSHCWKIASLKIKDIFDSQCIQLLYNFFSNTLPNYFQYMFQYKISFIYQNKKPQLDGCISNQNTWCMWCLAKSYPQIDISISADIHEKA